MAEITRDDITVVELSDNNSVTINTSGLGIGDYEFALDHINTIYQDEPFFDHVRAGVHTLYVRDKNGCGIAQLEFFIFFIPPRMRFGIVLVRLLKLKDLITQALIFPEKS